MSNFGENLRRIRKERRMTQDEFAELLGTSKQVLSRYERGERSPKVSIVEQFAKRLCIQISELTGTDAAPADDPWQLRADLAADPDRALLLSLARNGSAKDVRQVAALIDALKATNPDFYDGDDPA